MSKMRAADGEKNIIGKQVIELRAQHKVSQRELAKRLQLMGYDMDKNTIMRIEHGTRYVSDMEIKALCSIFDISYEELLGPRP